MVSGIRSLLPQHCLSRIQKSKSESSYIWRNNDASESRGISDSLLGSIVCGLLITLAVT